MQRKINNIHAVLFVMSMIFMATTAMATRYFWATSGTENGDLSVLRNWTTGSQAGNNSPSSFNAQDQYTIRDTSNLPAGIQSWYIDASLNMLGFLEVIRNVNIDLKGNSLSVKYLQSRGALSFSNGPVITSEQSFCGNQSTPGNCSISFVGEGTSFFVPEAKAVSISSSSVEGASNNRLEILDGAKMLSGRIAIGNNSAVPEGVNSTNNSFVVSGSGSSAKLNNVDLRAGKKNVFEISNGASVSITNAFTVSGQYCMKIGSYDRSEGDVVVVKGESSRLEVAGSVNMGTHANSHNHSFIVADGANASVGSFQIGQEPGSTGNAVRVEGAGSLLTVAGTTYVGGNVQTGLSNSRLDILDGATYETIENAQLWIGRFSNGCELYVSNGTAKVSGELRLGWASGDTNSGKVGGLVTIRIAGASPLLEVSGKVSSYSQDAFHKLIFDMPSSGWTSAPVKFKNVNKISYGTGTGLEICVNAKSVVPGRYVLIESAADINFDRIALSLDSSPNVEIDTTNTKELAVKVKPVGLVLVIR